MSLQDKIKSLKENQNERVNRSFEYTVEEWDQTLSVRRLTMADAERARRWAKKNYRAKEAAASGVAMVCIAVLNDELPLTVENIDFLLGEPVPVIKGLIEFVNEISELTDNA